MPLDLGMTPILAVLGPPEIAIILFILLLLFGAKKLPELARGMGRSAGEFKRAREEFENELAEGEKDSEKKG